VRRASARVASLGTALALAAGAAACTRKGPALSPLAERGRTVYQTSCIACHNADPRKAGAVGPEIFGSSMELLTARVLKAEYPPGYAPKRTTIQMAPLPQLEKDLPALHAFLNE
jgi:mono/diheme cytochrome c family protein